VKAARIEEDSRKVLKAAWRQSPPSRFLDYKDFLRTLLAAAEEVLGRYSYQQFSNDLGFTAGNVAYVVIHGYRKLSAEQAETIIGTLGITGPERRYLIRLREYTDCRVEAERLELFQGLVEIKDQVLEEPRDRLMLRFFGEWHHAAIFELMDLDEFRSDPEWIASCFYKRLTAEQATKSLGLLSELGLIAYDEAAGRHVKRQRTLTTGPEVQGLAAAGYHLQMIQLGQEALSQIPAEEREIGAMTLSVSEAVLGRLKEDLRLLRRYAVFLSEQCEAPERLVQLNFQLFPITK
jgi:uncharacterized protein (TIGR02147 family)